MSQVYRLLNAERRVFSQWLVFPTVAERVCLRHLRHGKSLWCWFSTPSIEAMNERHGGTIASEKGGIMKKSKIKAIIEKIDTFAKMGVLSLDEHIALRKAVSRLLHAVSIKDMSEVEKAVGKIAKLLLKNE